MHYVCRYLQHQSLIIENKVKLLTVNESFSKYVPQTLEVLTGENKLKYADPPIDY